MKQCPFLLRLCQEVLLRVFKWFFFFRCLFCRKRKVNAECVSLPHEWNRRPHTAGQTGKNDCCHPAEQVPSDRKQSYFLCCGLPFSRFRWCLFPFGDSFFYGFSPEVFFYTICLCFVDTNWKVRRILIEKSSIHNWLQNYYKFKIFIYLVSFFVFP